MAAAACSVRAVSCSELPVVVGEGGVGPGHQLVAVLGGNAQQLERGSDGQFDGHLGEEIALPGLGDGRRHAVQDGGVPAPAARASCARARARGATAGVTSLRSRWWRGVVGHVEEDPGGEPVGEVVDEGSPARRARVPAQRRTSRRRRPRPAPARSPRAPRSPPRLGCARSARATTPVPRGAAGRTPRGETLGEAFEVGQVDALDTPWSHASIVAASPLGDTGQESATVKEQDRDAGRRPCSPPAHPCSAELQDHPFGQWRSGYHRGVGAQRRQRGVSR